MVFWGVRSQFQIICEKTRVCLEQGSPRALGVGFYELGICQQATKRPKAEMLVCYMPLGNSASAAVVFGTGVRCNQLKCGLFYSVLIAVDGCESSSLAVPCALCFAHLPQRLGKRKGLASGAMVLYLSLIHI